MDGKVDLKKLCTQLEFYFGDSNLPYDKFFQTYVQNEPGWVPIEVFLKFNMVKKMGTKSVEEIKAAIKLSEGLITLDEKETSVRRIKPMPSKESMEKRLERTLHFKCDPDNKLSPEETKKALNTFGKILYFSVYKSKNKPNKKNPKTGVVEFSTIKEASNAIDCKDGKVEGFEGVTFSFISLGSLKRKEKEEEEQKYLCGFNKDKILEIHSVPLFTKFIDLRKKLYLLLKNNNDKNVEGEIDANEKENGTNKTEKKENNDQSSESQNIEKQTKDTLQKEGMKNKSKEKTEMDGAKEIKQKLSAEDFKKVKGMFKGDFFNDNEYFIPPVQQTKQKDTNKNSNSETETEKEKKHYVILRINSESDLTAESLVRVMLERNCDLVGVLLPEEEAREKWIKSMKMFRNSFAGRKRKRR